MLYPVDESIMRTIRQSELQPNVLSLVCTINESFLCTQHFSFVFAIGESNLCAIGESNL